MASADDWGTTTADMKSGALVVARGKAVKKPPVETWAVKRDRDMKHCLAVAGQWLSFSLARSPWISLSSNKQLKEALQTPCNMSSLESIDIWTTRVQQALCYYVLLELIMKEDDRVQQFQALGRGWIFILLESKVLTKYTKMKVWFESSDRVQHDHEMDMRAAELVGATRDKYLWGYNPEAEIVFFIKGLAPARPLVCIQRLRPDYRDLDKWAFKPEAKIKCLDGTLPSDAEREKVVRQHQRRKKQRNKEKDRERRLKAEERQVGERVARELLAKFDVTDFNPPPLLGAGVAAAAVAEAAPPLMLASSNGGGASPLSGCSGGVGSGSGGGGGVVVVVVGGGGGGGSSPQRHAEANGKAQNKGDPLRGGGGDADASARERGRGGEEEGTDEGCCLGGSRGGDVSPCPLPNGLSGGGGGGGSGSEVVGGGSGSSCGGGDGGGGGGSGAVASAAAPAAGQPTSSGASAHLLRTCTIKHFGVGLVRRTRVDGTLVLDLQWDSNNNNNGADAERCGGGNGGNGSGATTTTTATTEGGALLFAQEGESAPLKDSSGSSTQLALSLDSTTTAKQQNEELSAAPLLPLLPPPASERNRVYMYVPPPYESVVAVETWGQYDENRRRDKEDKAASEAVDDTQDLFQQLLAEAKADRVHTGGAWLSS